MLINTALSLVDLWGLLRRNQNKTKSSLKERKFRIKAKVKSESMELGASDYSFPQRRQVTIY